MDKALLVMMWIIIALSGILVTTLLYQVVFNWPTNC